MRLVSYLQNMLLVFFSGVSCKKTSWPGNSAGDIFRMMIHDRSERLSLGIKYLRILVPGILHSKMHEDLKGHDNSKLLVCQQHILIQLLRDLQRSFREKCHECNHLASLS